MTLGGSAGDDAAIGSIIGPAFSAEEVVGAIETILDTYLEVRTAGEHFIDTYRRLGPEPFKETLYGAH